MNGSRLTGRRIRPIIQLLFIFGFVLGITSDLRPLGAQTGVLAANEQSSAQAVYHIWFSDQADLNYLATFLDIWEVDFLGGKLVASLSPEQHDALVQAGYRIEPDLARTVALSTPLQLNPGQTSGIPGYSCYRTVEETYASMLALANQYPGLVEMVDIGESWDKVTPGESAGYDLYAIVITNQASPAPKSRFFLMAETHARELATAETALRFGEYLVENYGSDPDITWLLDYTEIHIVPMQNPDGRKFAEAGVWWRKNTDSDDGCSTYPNYGTDLNRNHSFKWGGASSNPCVITYQGPSSDSEPETQAIQAYVRDLYPDQRGNADEDPAPVDATGTFITLHSYGRLVLFPWGWTATTAPNHAALETLGRKFGFYNQYEVCQSGGAGCIYQTTGSSDDWAYGRLGVAAYTFELGTDFFQSCTYFENTILPDNLPALLYAAKAARRPYQNPSGPDVLGITVTPTHVIAGSSIALSGNADDTRFDSHGWGTEPVENVMTARFSVDAPSWITGTVTFSMTATDGAFDTSVETVQGLLDTTSITGGQHTVFIESQDADGNWGVPSAIFIWVDTNPYHVFVPLLPYR